MMGVELQLEGVYVAGQGPSGAPLKYFRLPYSVSKLFTTPLHMAVETYTRKSAVAKHIDDT